jgi:hypothetical protein
MKIPGETADIWTVEVIVDRVVGTSEGAAVGAVVGAAAAVVAGLVEPPLEPPDGAEPDPPPIPFTAAHVPVKDPESSATVILDVTSEAGPGLGYCTSLPSTVVQPLPRFATKRSGLSEYEVEGADPEPLLMVIEAQSI